MRPALVLIKAIGALAFFPSSMEGLGAFFTLPSSGTSVSGSSSWTAS